MRFFESLRNTQCVSLSKSPSAPTKPYKLSKGSTVESVASDSTTATSATNATNATYGTAASSSSVHNKYSSNSPDCDDVEVDDMLFEKYDMANKTEISFDELGPVYKCRVLEEETDINSDCEKEPKYVAITKVNTKSEEMQKKVEEKCETLKELTGNFVEVLVMGSVSFIVQSILSESEKDIRLGTNFETMETYLEGGYGKVFKCKKRDSDAVYAVKEILYERKKNAEFLVYHECDMFARFVGDEEVCQLDSWFHSEKATYIVTKFYANGDLFDLLKKWRHAPAPMEDRLAIARSLCKAMDVMHNKSTNHFDLKPENVLLKKVSVVNTDGVEVMEYRAVLSDLGFARDFGKGPIWSPHDNKFLYLGTVSYASPELLNTGKTIDRKSDLYSLGKILNLVFHAGVSDEICTFNKKKSPVTYWKKYMSRYGVTALGMFLAKMLVVCPTKRMMDVPMLERAALEENM